MTTTAHKPHRPLAAAWEDWTATVDGKKCLGGDSIGLPPRQQEYLRNRLWCAFMAGAHAVVGTPRPATQPHPAQRRKAGES